MRVRGRVVGVDGGGAYRALEGILEQIEQLLACILVLVPGEKAEDGPRGVHVGDGGGSEVCCVCQRRRVARERGVATPRGSSKAHGPEGLSSMYRVELREEEVGRRERR